MTHIKDNSETEHGSFFFAKFLVNDGSTRKSPVFIISNDNDDEDIIICSCTKQPAKTDFDVKVKLKYETYVRTNKIYTIHRSQLLFKIPQRPQPQEYNEIVGKLKLALKLTE